MSAPPHLRWWHLPWYALAVVYWSVLAGGLLAVYAVLAAWRVAVGAARRCLTRLLGPPPRRRRFDT